MAKVEQWSLAQIYEAERGDLLKCMNADAMRKKWLLADKYVEYLMSQYKIGLASANVINNELRNIIYAQVRLINPNLLKEVLG